MAGEAYIVERAVRLRHERTLRAQHEGRRALGKLDVTVFVKRASVGYQVGERHHGLTGDRLRWTATRTSADRELAKRIGRLILDGYTVHEWPTRLDTR